LAAFQPDNADRFFGRDRLVDELVTRLARGRFLAVFGASGSGKSSLLRAGLLPAVRAGRLPDSQDWPTVLLTPGEHPLQELAIHVAALRGIAPGSLHTDLRTDPSSFDLAVRQALADRSPTTQLLVVVDQFEEVFTLCRDEGERAGVVAALLVAVAAPFAVESATSLRNSMTALSREAAAYEDLDRAIAASGGVAATERCGRVVTGPYEVQVLAWKLHRHGMEVGIDPRPPGTLFAPRRSEISRAPGFDPVAATARWVVRRACGS
jgi:energy-coupling factor transporter ATP-binding protein EcfA2